MNLTLDNTPEDLQKRDLVIVVTSKHGANAMLFWGLSDSKKSARVIPLTTQYYSVEQCLQGKTAFWQNCPLSSDNSAKPFCVGRFGERVIPYPEEMLDQAQRQRYHQLKQLLGC